MRARRLRQIAYASRAFGFDESILAGILLDARRCNTRDCITGALICRADIYLQLLEGPRDRVEAAFARIRADDRHTNVHRLVDRDAAAPLFAGWAMHHDPAASWMWTQAEVDSGAIDRASERDVMAVFERMMRRPNG